MNKPLSNAERQERKESKLVSQGLEQVRLWIHPATKQRSNRLKSSLETINTLLR